MPKGYGISKDTKGLLAWNGINERLSKARNYWVGTTRPDGRPHIMPVWGVWIDRNFYFGTERNSRKSRNLLNNPAVIAMHMHELDRLPEEPRREIRRLQRLYVEEWVSALTALRPELSPADARVLAHAAFGLMNSTPFLSGEVDRERCAELLRAAALASLVR